MVSTGPKKPSSPTLSKLTLKSTAPQPTLTSLQNVNSNSTMEVTDAISVSSGATITVATGASASSCSPHFSPYAAGLGSVGAPHDVDPDDLVAALASSARDQGDLSPSESMMGGSRVAERPPVPPARALSKRKYPKLLTQLAREFRWMHKNLRHGHNSNVTPRVSCIYGASPSLSSLSSSSTCIGEDSEDLLCTTTLRSSMRRSSSLKSSMMCHGGSSPTHCTRGAASSTKLCRRTPESGEVEQVQPAALPKVTPDPYAPPSCQYVVRDLAFMVPGDDAFGSARNGSSASSVMRAASGGRVDRAAAVLGTTYMAESAFSLGEGGSMEGPYRGYGDSPSAVDFGRDDTSDVEEVCNIAAGPSDRRGLKVDGAGSPSDIHEDAQAGGDAAASGDSYQVFFSSVVDLKRRLHNLEQQTASLRALYAQEQRARLRFKGKGQHLSWTRTVEAANTIHFWRQKVSISRLFESQYLSVLKSFQRELQLVDPKAEKAQQLRRSPASAAAKPGSTAGVMQARRAFLSSLQVIAVQEQHLKELGDQMEACWKANAVLREDLRHFEQWEVRVPHETFATAGMDVEHFIASLPPRASVCGLHSVLSHTSVHSLESLESAETPMLLTAQNLSFTSSGDDGDDNVVNAASTDSRATGAYGCGSNGSSHSGHHPTPPSPCGADASPVMPKRLKYVIRSVALDHEERGGDNSSSRIAPSYIGSSTPTTNSQTRRRSERHVTFALEPEVLDARPRFSAHSRTVELLEQICLDKQSPWNALSLLQSALEERLGQLAQLRMQWDGAVTGEAPTLTPRVTPQPCTIATSSSGGAVCHSRDKATVPSPKSFPSATTSTLMTKGKSSRYSKVKPKACTTCSAM
ncbi:hypothetical protein, unknown function [Leishmania infantum JPCM5]|uniref:Uncharacterized protein n=2 Tax=Leishmania infantum TaxID=5671 RepID=A4I3N3_LEIIN|nr:hypothetical protein, unknown function [Leishmania infantum JPCM5]CAC9503610.1 hypothetical_protein_-_conserved [Leishmania infantum]CAM69388.1 hypothetical protein, unknown function [Leishmania infantum JPCM5]SUZ43327.1 hypothetical_protein_-_conserved [Leishmania infantum]|eukprot:XP_001470195.1 hypothetical protein, unknown function [Leishmania infantum JPCM5]